MIQTSTSRFRLWVNQRKGWTAVLGRGTVKQRSETSSDWHSRYTSMINRCQRCSWIAPYSLASFSVNFLGYVQWVAQARITCQQQKLPCTGTFRWALSYLGCTPVSDVSALCWQWPLFLCVSLPDLWWAFWGACCLLLWQTWGCVAHFFGNHSSVLCSSLTDRILWQSAVLHISLANTALHCTVSSLTEFSDIWSAVLHISLANTASCYTVLWQTQCCLVLLSFFLSSFFLGGGGGGGAQIQCCTILWQTWGCVAYFFVKYGSVVYSSLTNTVLCTTFLFFVCLFFVLGGGGHIQCCVVQFSVRCSAVLYSSLVDKSAGLYKQCSGWQGVLQCCGKQCCVVQFCTRHSAVLNSPVLDTVLCCTILC